MCSHSLETLSGARVLEGDVGRTGAEKVGIMDAFMFHAEVQACTYVAETTSYLEIFVYSVSVFHI